MGAGVGQDSRSPQRREASFDATSTSLLRRAAARDGAAWERLVELSAPLVYGCCRRAGLQAADAADVAQEVFAAVARKLEDFRHDRPGDSFHAWLSTIVRNKIHDHFRARHPAQPAGGTEAQMRLAEIANPWTETSAPGSPAPSSCLEHRAVQIVRAGVEERTWRAFWLLTVEGRDGPSVAQELGMSLSAVYDANYRLRRKLRQEFEGLIE